MKPTFMTLLALCLPLVGVDKKPKIIPNGPKAKAAIDKEIRFRLDKPTGTLTEPDLGKVKTLDLTRKKISDVSALKELRQLTSLHLESNQLGDTDSLKELRQLQELSINHNQIRDVSALKELRYPDLGFNQITNLSALKELKLLTHLDLRNNPDLPNAQVTEIRTALPKCRIYSNPTK